MELFNSNINTYCTRNMAKGGLIRSAAYGDKTLRFTIPIAWDEFIKCNNYNSIRNIYHLKSHIKIKYLNVIIFNL